MKRIAIQGTYGSYHDIAAHLLFEKEQIDLICCKTFEDIFNVLKNEPQTLGLLAIENTIAGSLLYNNELVKQSDTQIIGEQKLRISHCFACLPEEDWNDLTEVNSHPIALMQCRAFLNEHPELKIVEGEDTAMSAKKIKENNLKGHAAICSEEAANQYNMKILQKSIETNKHNFTRFLLVANEPIVNTYKASIKPNKTSLVFTLPHEEGSLSQVLSVFSFYQMNLTKIQSLPIIGREWEYQFYIDVTYSNYERYLQALTAIKPLISQLKILGEYAKH
ncbi:MAG: prephenate dehydratase [Bacteroides sp.]|nr:prephenate dehydratase [Bacteroides sp.]MDD4720312.1 prephenate dehydratase [Bacteroides sp.]